MCLVLSCNPGLVAMRMQLWLSHPIETGFGIEIFSSDRRFRSYNASFVASAAARYSASADDRATSPCFLEFQVVGAHPIPKIYPAVDFLSSASPP